MLWLVIISLIFLPLILISIASTTVLYYTNARQDTSIVPSTISIIGLSLVLLYAGLIPIDVFAAERVVHIGNFIRDLYYITVSALLVIVFGGVPFAYFYANAMRNYDSRSTCELISKACRHTTICLCLLMLLLLIAIVVHTVLAETTPTTYDTVGTMKRLFHSQETGHAVLNLTVGFLILMGTINLWIYTALGLAALPIVGCIKLGWTGVRDSCQPTSVEDELEKRKRANNMNTSRKEQERKTAYDELARQRIQTTRDRQNMYNKYGVTGRTKGGKMSKRARKKTAQLNQKQNYLTERLQKLEAESDRLARERGTTAGGGTHTTTCCRALWRIVLRIMIRGGYNCLKLPM
jgi:hypothetical protein